MCPVRVHEIVESRFRLDGGAMFGVVPKPLWERHFPADDRNRIELVCRVLVVEGDETLALVDAGMGDAWTEREREIYGLEEAAGIEPGLAALGFRSSDVTDVVLTHLHFDHAGGIVRADGSLRFPGATHHVQRANLALATSPSPKDAGSYRPATVAGLRQAHHRLLDGAGEVLPGIHARLSGGHTEGLQMIEIDAVGGPILFPADLIPTHAHVHLPWIMAYDNHPLRMLDEKRALLDELVGSGGRLVFEHDPAMSVARIRREDGRYRAERSGFAN